MKYSELSVTEKLIVDACVADPDMLRVLTQILTQPEPRPVRHAVAAGKPLDIEE